MKEYSTQVSLKMPLLMLSKEDEIMRDPDEVRAELDQ